MTYDSNYLYYPSVSVIIPTYNGAHKILPVLRSLAHQSIKPQEVLVIVDGSTDSTVDILSSLPFYLHGFRFFCQANQGRAAVRNRGASESSHELLIFLDDDILPPQHWLENHIHEHLAHPDSIISGNLVVSDDFPNSDFCGYRLWLHQHWCQKLNDAPQGTTTNVNYLAGANFSIPRHLFARIGGFDTRLRDAEDYDFAVRAKLCSIYIHYSNKAFAINADRDLITVKKYITRLREYTNAHKLLNQIKPDVHQSISITQGDSQLTLWKKLVFLALAHYFWISIIELKLLCFLPARFRYKLYDIIVTSNTIIYPDRVKL